MAGGQAAALTGRLVAFTVAAPMNFFAWFDKAAKQVPMAGPSTLARVDPLQAIGSGNIAPGSDRVP